MPANSAFPDLIDVLVNVGAVIPSIIMMLQGIVVLMGLYLVSHSLVEIWGVTHDNAMKYVAGRQRFSVGSALISMFIGSILLAIGTLELVGILSRTLTGDYANSRITADALSYTGGGGLTEKAHVATLAMLGIMQVIGLIAMVKGWLTVNRYYNQQGQAGLGQATGWIVGGLADHGVAHDPHHRPDACHPSVLAHPSLSHQPENSYMKALKTLTSAYHNILTRLTTLMMVIAAPSAFAIQKTDLTQDTAGGKTFSNIAENIDNTAQEGATLLISLVSIGGFVVVAISLYTLWKASKDEREKPMSAVVGLFIGGLMAGVGSVMWIMRNTVIG